MAGARTESGKERVTSRVQNEQRMEIRLDAAPHDYRHGHHDHNRHELILSGGRFATRTPGGGRFAVADRNCVLRGILGTV
jgi:hypothetical protein